MKKLRKKISDGEKMRRMMAQIKKQSEKMELKYREGFAFALILHFLESQDSGSLRFSKKVMDSAGFDPDSFKEIEFDESDRVILERIFGAE